MDISVVIPLYNEAESLPELAAWIDRVMKEHDFSYAATTASHRRSTPASKPLPAMWSSPWTLTCRTPQTRYPNYTE